MLLGVGAAVPLWLVASHSGWELALSILSTAAIGLGLYWMLAALIPLWPFSLLIGWLATSHEDQQISLEAPPGHVPPLSPRFHNRPVEMSSLKELLSRERRAAIVGLGGVGKTQLTSAYIEEHTSEFDFIWWLRSSHREVLVADYEAIASALALDTKAYNLRVLVGSWLAKQSRWLLVFDDVTDAAHVQDFLPSKASKGKVILTSRSRLDIPASVVELQDWSPDDASAFLRSQVDGPKESIDAICDQLFNVPLALDQAAAYMNSTGINASSYLQLSRENAKELLNSGRAFSRNDSVATTWAISIDTAESEAAGARDLLVLCSFYADGAIPRQLPPRITATKEIDNPAPRRFRRLLADDLSYNNILAALARQSLLTLDDTNLYVHGLVQSAVRAGLPPHIADSWTSYAAESLWSLLRQLAEQKDSEEQMRIAELLLPHVLSVAERAEDNIPQTWPQMHNWPCWIAIRESARSLQWIADYLAEASDKSRGLDAALRALEFATEAFPFLLGFYPANEAAAYYMLCGAAETVGLYAELTNDAADAEPALRKAFALFRRQEPKRPVLIGRAYRFHRMHVQARFRILFSLIRALMVVGKIEEAQELARKAEADLSRYKYLDPRGDLREPRAAIAKITKIDSHTVPDEPMFTLQSRGLISLNEAAFKALGEPVAVALLYDVNKGIIGLRKVPRAYHACFRVRKQASPKESHSHSEGKQASMTSPSATSTRLRKSRGLNVLTPQGALHQVDQASSGRQALTFAAPGPKARRR